MKESMDRRRFLGRSASVVGGASLLGAAPVAGVGRLVGAAHADRCELESQVVLQAWQDEGFKRQLMSDPQGALGRVFRKEIPRDVRIQVVEETADTVYMVIPQNPNTYIEAKDLNPGELRILARGITVKTACAIPSTMSVPGWFFAMGYYERPVPEPGNRD